MQESSTRLIVPVRGFRGGRTGGFRFWTDLLDRCRNRGLPLVTEEDVPGPAPPGGLSRLLWNDRMFGGLERGVLAYDSSDHGAMARLARRMGGRNHVRRVAVVHHLRERFRFRVPAYARLAGWNENALLRLADRVITHTDDTREAIVARGVPRDRITVIRQGWRCEPPRAEIRDLDSGEPLRLLWVGGDFDRKQLPLLLEAIAACPQPRPLLQVVGSAEGSAEMNRSVSRSRELGLGESVSFLGGVTDEDLASRWLGSDAFVLPSLREGHGRAVDEALNHGLPVVVSDLAVFRERLREDDVIFVPGGDRGAWTRALIRVRDRSLRRELAERGFQRSRGFPTWEATLDAHVDVFAEQLQGVDPQWAPVIRSES